MGKIPSFPFYPGDWVRDPELRMASCTSRGIWIDCLCNMWWSKERGVLRGTREGIARMVGATQEELERFISEAKSCGFADLEENNDGTLTLISRRLVREEKAKENHKLRQRRYLEKQQYDAEMTDERQEYDTEMQGGGVSQGRHLEKEKEKEKILGNEDLEDLGASKALKPETSKKPVSGNGKDRSPPYQEIISDLNEVLGTQYKSTTKEVQKLIRARLEEGFTLEDFRKVHRNMKAAWESDTEMAQFLRPHTLYTGKFEAYLNRRAGPPKGMSREAAMVFELGEKIAREMKEKEKC